MSTKSAADEALPKSLNCLDPWEHDQNDQIMPSLQGAFDRLSSNMFSQMDVRLMSVRIIAAIYHHVNLITEDIQADTVGQVPIPI